jgi:hypothetical protein
MRGDYNSQLTQSSANIHDDVPDGIGVFNMAIDKGSGGARIGTSPGPKTVMQENYKKNLM